MSCESAHSAPVAGCYDAMPDVASRGDVVGDLELTLQKRHATDRSIITSQELLRQ